MAAVDDEDGAGHVARRIGSEQQHGVVEVFETPKASPRDAFDQCFAGGRAPERLIELRFYVAWGNRIDANAMACPFERKRLGQLD